MDKSAVRAGIIVMLFGLALTYFLFREMRQSSWEDLRLKFQSDAQEQAGIFIDHLDTDVKHFEIIRRYLNCSNDVDRQEFHSFVQPFFHNCGFDMIYWVPSVSGAKRAQFESKARADGIAGFEIKEVNKEGKLVRARNKSEYFPVFYQEPAAAGQGMIGVDLVSDPMILNATKIAQESGELVVTESQHFAYGHKEKRGYWALIPLFEDNGKSRELKGLLMSRFVASDFFKNIIKSLKPRGFSLFLRDITSINDPVLLFMQSPKISEGRIAEDFGLSLKNS
ncbi:MAG: CHASE domain-containing protein, partial [Victivallaceae bacterium]